MFVVVFAAGLLALYIHFLATYIELCRTGSGLGQAYYAPRYDSEEITNHILGTGRLTGHMASDHDFDTLAASSGLSCF
jgi:hypothetical protein